MNMRSSAAPYGGAAQAADFRIGDAFPIIEAVYKELDKLKYIAEHSDKFAKRDIELRANMDLQAIEWRYKDQDDWLLMITFSDLVQVDLLTFEQDLHAAVAEAQDWANHAREVTADVDKIIAETHQARDQAIAAASSTGIFRIFKTKAEAESNIVAVPLGKYIEVLSDESYNGYRTRYEKTVNGYEFAVNLDAAIESSLRSVVRTYPDYAAASAAASTLPDEQPVEIEDDETKDNRSTRYVVQVGALVFVDYLPYAQTVSTIAELRTLSKPARKCIVTVSGYYTAGDGGGGCFLWIPASSKVDDGGTVIQPTAGGAGRWERSPDTLKPIMFGITGAEADTTAPLVKLLAAAAGKRVKFESGKTYNFTQFAFPANTTVEANGVVFSRIIASSATHGITINDGVTIDNLTVTALGGDVAEKTVRIAGSRIRIGLLSVKAVSVGVYNKTHFGIELTHPSGGQLKDIQIDLIETANYNSHVYGKNIDNLVVKAADMSVFRVGCYFVDIKNSAVDNVSIKGTSPNCWGTNGENGLLLEATSKYSTENLSFTNWEVIGSGEHGFRLGGAYSIRNVHFNGCKSAKSGSAILVNHPAATQWHGGSGFKVLGGTTLANQFHEDIFFTDCIVEDVNDSYGAFPAGHGPRNFGAYQIGVSNGVHLSNCKVRKKDNALYSCGQAVDMINAHHVYIDNPEFLDCYDSAIYTYESGDVGAYPGYDGGCSHIYVNGGQVHTARNIGQVVHIAGQFTGSINVVNFAHTDIHINTMIRGCASAFRVNPLAAGKAARIFVNSTYYDSSVDDATTTSPVVTGTQVALLTMRAPWRPNQAFNPEGVGGSMIQDTLGKGTYVKNGTSAWKLL